MAPGGTLGAQGSREVESGEGSWRLCLWLSPCFSGPSLHLPVFLSLPTCRAGVSGVPLSRVAQGGAGWTAPVACPSWCWLTSCPRSPWQGGR